MTKSTPTPAQKIAASPHASVWVEASAGTGKTKILTDRVLNLLLKGTLPDRILCLTFTKAAAAEMMGRVREKLALWHACSDEMLYQELEELQGTPPTQIQLEHAKQLFHRFMDAANPMRIQTIHGFCQSLLKRFPLEAGLSPYFNVIDEFESKKLLDRACQMAFDDFSNYGTFIQYIAPSTFQRLIQSVISQPHQLKNLLKIHENFKKISQALAKFLEVEFEKSSQQLLLEAWGEQIASKAFFTLAIPILYQAVDLDSKLLTKLEKWQNFSGAIDEETFLEYANIFLTKKDEPRKSIISAKVKKNYGDIEDIILNEANQLIILKERYKNTRIWETTHELLMFIESVLKEYEVLKNHQNALDYQDLIDYAAALMENRDKAPWVLYKLDGGIDHILVDEAQDTSPDQWKVIVALVQEFYVGEAENETRRTLFVVGDTKQSIYSFQGADPLEFHNVKRDLSQRAQTHVHPWEEVTLNTSFRSTKAVLEAVDLVFQMESVRSGVSTADFQHLPHRENEGGVVEVWPLIQSPESDVEESLGVYEPSTQEHLADAIARTIQGWLTNREILESKGRPIKPQDIMILLRKRDSLAGYIIRALKFYDIPVAGLDRMVLKNQLVVQDLIALGEFLLLPEDDLTLATVLKGPLIGLDEDCLFSLCHGRGSNSLWQELKHKKDQTPVFGHAHQFLKGLLAKVDYLTPYGLYMQVLSELNGMQKLVESLGADAIDPIQEFLNLALKYEDKNPPSLQGFLAYVQTSSLEIKRNLDDGDIDQVRLMTVHGAKGLQSPIVFLPDTTSIPGSRRTLFWGNDLMMWCPSSDLKTTKLTEIQNDSQSLEMQEYRRLMYVALTRAEDRLYILGAEPKRGRPEESWYNLIHQALSSVAVSFHMEVGDLKGMGLRLKSAQLKEVFYQGDGGQKLRKNQPMPTWISMPLLPENLPRFFSPSRFEDYSKEDVALNTKEISSINSRERGILIHKLLEKLPNLPQEQWMKKSLEFLESNTPVLDPDSHHTIIDQAIKIITHPDLIPYFQPSSVAEVPLIGIVDGQYFKGQVDRLAIDHVNKTIYILDYKTGDMVPNTVNEVPNTYVKQMQIYGELASKIYPKYKIYKSLFWTKKLKLIHL